MKDAVIIISGGMDSTTMLYEFKDEIALAITFDYGSTQNGRERVCAVTHCQRLGIKHIIVPLEFMHRYFKSALLMTADDIPEGNYDDENMKSTVVPFRNGIMLAIAAGGVTRDCSSHSTSRNPGSVVTSITTEPLTKVSPRLPSYQPSSPPTRKTASPYRV